jgi:hypothetical protein
MRCLRVESRYVDLLETLGRGLSKVYFGTALTQDMSIPLITQAVRFGGTTSFARARLSVEDISCNTCGASIVRTAGVLLLVHPIDKQGKIE